MEFKRLKDKVIVISGGTKGVGRAFAEVAGREGARVVIGGRDEKAGKVQASPLIQLSRLMRKQERKLSGISGHSGQRACSSTVIF